jgi:hypothetical protein
MNAAAPEKLIWNAVARIHPYPGNAINRSPLDPPGSSLKLTAPKQCLKSFIWQQGWPEQSAVRAAGGSI